MEGMELARTRAIVPRLVVLAQTGSTNADLLRAVGEDPDRWPHLSAIVTADQRGGRGRRGRTWVAPPGAALAVSLVVSLPLPVAMRGWISLLAGAAMTRSIGMQLDEVALKWPNDVLVGGRKICGILAEIPSAQPNTVVVGAGINTAMTVEQLPVETATSFAVHGVTADEDAVLAEFVRQFGDDLSLLAETGDAQRAGLRARVIGQCATVGSRVVVSLPGGESIHGTATDIDSDGRLLVASDAGGEHAVSAGDVVHVR